jgi:pyruvate dehydrogenase E1 component beta subunit
MSSNNRKITYGIAINEALRQMMTNDESVFLIGQGVKSPWYVGSTCTGLIDEFGEERVIDTPVSENAITGCAVGAAIADMRSIVVHPRMDFMLYAFDPIINEAANWYYMNGGKKSVPTVIWGIINRGGEQGAQHSQSLHGMFAHVPGLKVVMPSTPHDAKGLMIAAIKDNNPVVFIDDRWLYDIEGEVPEEIFEVPIGKGRIQQKGKDVTIVANSYLVKEAIDASIILSEKGIETEIIDLRSIKPFDGELILQSIKKTGRLIVLDGGWLSFGISAEISAYVAENGFKHLKCPIKRIALPDCPAPASRILEKEYYSFKNKIIFTTSQMMDN